MPAERNCGRGRICHPENPPVSALRAPLSFTRTVLMNQPQGGVDSFMEAAALFSRGAESVAWRSRRSCEADWPKMLRRGHV